MLVSRAEFRDAMARLGSAVNVVTTAGPAGRVGFTASAVCSVTDDPPTLLVCMNRASGLNPVFKTNGVLCVNTLAAGHRRLSDLFAGFPPGTMDERFAASAWDTVQTGAPVLREAVVAFDCRIADVVEKGTHSVLFAEIAAIRQGPGSAAGLIYFGRDYHDVGVPA